ncbi:MAG: sodium:proton antiporter [Fluviicola sp.]|nr:MAG: sodium:proton antiporter [Fluviicola sp.]
MTNTFIITICCLLLLAYVFDLTASKTKVPSVILLLFLGWGMKQLTGVFHISVPDLQGLLPILGTIGLIVIVLEGSLELELNRSKFSLIRKSIIVAVIPMMILGFLLAGAFYYYMGHDGDPTTIPDFRKSLIGAIPLCVISSAIAIPSAVNLSKRNKEFVTYESSLSDILGVLFFDFVFRNVTIDFHSFWIFLVQLLIIAVISFIATIGLSFLLGKIDHQIKFIPIIILTILIYALSKMYHLPALIFIMLFGLFIGNLDELKRFKLIERFKPQKLDTEVHKFHEILIEGTFLIRALFFLLFGFLIDNKELLNKETFFWAIGIVGAIFLIRFVQLKLAKLPPMPLMFVAPRGLITILLFLYISAEDKIDLVNKPLVIQVILLSVFIMMLGLMFNKNKDEKFTGKEASDLGFKHLSRELSGVAHASHKSITPKEVDPIKNGEDSDAEKTQNEKDQLKDEGGSEDDSSEEKKD